MHPTFDICAEVKRSRRLKITHHIPELPLYLPGGGGGGAGATFGLLATLESVAVHSAHFPAGLVSAGGVCVAPLAAARSRGRDQSSQGAGGRNTCWLPLILGADVSTAEPVAP